MMSSGAVSTWRWSGWSEIPNNEWLQANQQINRNNYYLYIVENFIKKPSITMLQNPAAYVDREEFDISISEYELSLRLKR